MRCTLCPVGCGADRTAAAGRCGTQGLTVAKYYLHPYEEPPISHTNGSGTVFFGGCSLKCVFCQNYALSRAERGKTISPKELTEIFRELEAMGADNVNLVTPDHVSDLIAEALSIYKPRIPVVYNSSGYAKKEALETIAPYVDIWMPDFKFYSPELSERYTGRRDYFSYASEAVAFMAKQPAIFREDGKMLSGLLVRHLVLPCCTGDSLKALAFLKDVLPAETPLSLMRQYTPMGEIAGFPELNRRITPREYRRVIDHALSLGFTKIYTQEKDCADESFIPAWDW
ncbi:MAG: radical SAM protein [Clostridia bacterium]|nr:radical SAM protein [Clostridia bacterium]